MRPCAICGDDFDPKGTTRKFCSQDHHKTCEVCGKDFLVTDLHRFALKRTCSYSCRSSLSHTDEAKAKREANSLARHGTLRPQQAAEVKAKTVKTNRERYGADYPNQNEEVRAKGYATNQERYGVAHPLQNEELKQKAADTLEANHGVRHPSSSQALRKLAQDSLETRYGVRHAWQSEEVKAKIRASYQERYGVEFPGQVPEIRAKAQQTFEEGVASGRIVKNYRISKPNQRLKALIEAAFPGVTVAHEKALGGKSFDLAVESANLLIEVNPTVTHNNSVSYACLINSCGSNCGRHTPLAKDYHYQRALHAQAHGYSLVQLYDWDTDEAILRMLSGRLEKGFTHYSARKLALKPIPQRLANRFLTLHHGQGPMKNQTHCYGLYSGSDLIAVATFGKARFGAREEYEWIRYAVKARAIVHGGPNRLWQAFVAEAQPVSAISYVNFDHTTAPSIFLSSCGFEEQAPTGPSLVWGKGAERIYNNSLLRLGADRLLGTAYGSRETSGLDNEAIMALEGWLPVYTAGNRVFTWPAAA